MTDERKQFLFDVFVTAMEGGVSYWAQIRGYHWKGKQGFMHDEDWDGFHAEVSDAEEDERPRWRMVNRSVIEVGLDTFERPTFKINQESRGTVLAAVRENDAGNIDAGLADCIVQAGLFGEIIYG